MRRARFTVGDYVIVSHFTGNNKAYVTAVRLETDGSFKCTLRQDAVRCSHCGTYLDAKTADFDESLLEFA